MQQNTLEAARTKPPNKTCSKQDRGRARAREGSETETEEDEWTRPGSNTREEEHIGPVQGRLHLDERNIQQSEEDLP